MQVSFYLIFIITNNTFQITSLDTIPDSTVVSLCFKGNDLYLSYRNRRIARHTNPVLVLP